jgi:hypothetical protein
MHVYVAKWRIHTRHFFQKNTKKQQHAQKKATSHTILLLPPHMTSTMTRIRAIRRISAATVHGGTGPHLVFCVTIRRSDKAMATRFAVMLVMRGMTFTWFKNAAHVYCFDNDSPTQLEAYLRRQRMSFGVRSYQRAHVREDAPEIDPPLTPDR